MARMSKDRFEELKEMTQKHHVPSELLDEALHEINQCQEEIEDLRRVSVSLLLHYESQKPC